jgi:hypothetical protein
MHPALLLVSALLLAVLVEEFCNLIIYLIGRRP